MKFLKYIFLITLGITIYSSNLFAEEKKKVDKDKKDKDKKQEARGFVWFGFPSGGFGSSRFWFRPVLDPTALYNQG